MLSRCVSCLSREFTFFAWRTWAISCLIVGTMAFVTSARAEESELLDTSDFDAYEGFYDFYWDDAEGKIWLRLANDDQDVAPDSFLYTSSLATGLGSNPVGLDRGQLGAERLVHFRRVGQSVYLIQENTKFRALGSQEPSERQAVRDSFASSVLWSGKLKKSDQGLLVDLTSFLLRDAHDCVGTLSSTDQGSFSLDKERSFVHLPRTKAFPLNSEFEVALTFSSKKPGRLANRTAAEGKSITLRQHHSFVKLPEPGYSPRKWDPRVGSFAMSFSDYASAIEEPLEKRWITRHRLEKTDPTAAKSTVKKPIVYYLDPGAPEPVRSALLEGARWWNEAFESAGFIDAYQVKMLPEDADPMDVRYNVIQWVHRATRGWSYGQSFTDPRTGEIIKGHVLLGSLRVRQDHLLFSGMRGADSTRSGARGCACGMGCLPSDAYLSQLDPQLSDTEVALARIRQLSAHEVGHTLGFAHNFAASTYADRASVMDYPSPRAKIVDGEIDLSDAYGVGIGEWDKFAVQYSYSQFPPDADESEELEKLIRWSLEKGYKYITDADARPSGAAQPYGNLWDNGSDPVAALKHEMNVRKIAIENFDASVLHPDQPLADLEKAFVPVYLHHRFQVDATAKVLGGFEYSYAFAGDGQTIQSPIAQDRQRAALEVLLTTISPEALAIPKSILNSIPPRTNSSISDNERFSSRTGPIFDPGSAMQAAAELTLGNLLQPQRASRMARSGTEFEQLGLSEVIERIVKHLTPEPVESITPQEREARRIVWSVFVDKLMKLSQSNQATADARHLTRLELRELQSKLSRKVNQGGQKHDVALWIALATEINRFLDRPYPSRNYNPTAELPPGSPIGQ